MTMLNRLLALLQAGGTHRVADLAHRLETTPELIEVMLEDLARMGYLKPVGEECGGGCGGCSLAGLCAAGTPSTSLRAGSGRVWTLTER
jgi:DNA-binding IscR family transcriptional regulator